MKQSIFISGLFILFSFTQMQAQQSPCSLDTKTLFTGEYGTQFNESYEAYQADTEKLKKLQTKGVSIIAVLGLWCEDSQREIPRLMRILETENLKNIPVNYYLVDTDKKCADPDVQSLNVQYVPALIFYRDGVEIGRIIEKPETSLEADIAKLLGN